MVWPCQAGENPLILGHISGLAFPGQQSVNAVMEKPAITSDVLSSLKSLSQLTSEELRALWPQWFDGPTPANIHRELLARSLAYQMQERTYGGLCAVTRKKLRALAKTLKDNPAGDIVETPRLTPGTRFIREWQDEMHQVTVDKAGFLYRGKRYKSLSEIARRITGTRWSGPRFFGIKTPAGAKRHARNGT